MTDTEILDGLELAYRTRPNKQIVDFAVGRVSCTFGLTPGTVRQLLAEALVRAKPHMEADIVKYTQKRLTNT